MSKELHSKLSKIQRELVCTKNLHNNFGSYNYRNLESIFDALKVHLGDELTVVVDENVLKIGERFYIESIATISDGESKISATAFARETQAKKGMDEAQITVATSSYAAKSALQKLFMLDDNPMVHDIDTRDNNINTLEIQKLLKKTNTDKLDFLNYYKIEKLTDLTLEQEAQAIEMLNKKVKK
jgi:hypothetical protein